MIAEMIIGIPHCDIERYPTKKFLLVFRDVVATTNDELNDIQVSMITMSKFKTIELSDPVLALWLKQRLFR